MAMIGAGMFLESCSSSLPLVKTSPRDKMLYVPLEKFTSQNNLVVVRSASLENDILVVRKQETYKALYLKCTHEGIGLSATDKKIVCPAHGSIFDLDGHVLKEPALLPLKEFVTEVTNENIIIHLS
jgi:cytochrome b6-f complex iron-sulfur subunit